MSVEKEGSSPEINHQFMIQYLLGELPPAWQEQFEERFFTDQESFAQLKRVEDQLVDDYVSDVLSDEQRKCFESYYLNSDRRRQKLKFAQALKRSLSEVTPISETRTSPSFWHSLQMAWQTPALWYSFAALMGLAFLVGGCLLWALFKLEKQRQQLEEDRAAFTKSVSENASQHSVPAESPTVTQKSFPSGSSSPTQSPLPKQIYSDSSAKTILSLALDPGTFRDNEVIAETRTLTITPQAKFIHLQLVLKGKEIYSDYRAVLETASGQMILTRSGLHPVKAGLNDFIVLTFPAQALPAEDYILTLSGKQDKEFEELEDYQFRIVKRH